MPVTFIQSGRFAASYSYTNAEAATLVAAMSSAPDDTRKGAIDTCIGAIKTAGVWTKLDCLWLWAGHDSQAGLLDWKRLSDATAVNSPTFTTDRGFTGDGSTSYINTNFTLSTDGVNYTQNSACMGAYINGGTDALSTTANSIGVSASGGTLNARIEPWRSVTPGSGARARINDNTATTVGTVTTRFGLTAVNRSGASAVQIYRNGSSIGSSTAASGSLPNIDVYTLGFNSGGSLGGASDNRFAAAFVGASLSGTEHADLFTAIEAYLDAIGAGAV
jgi:hypothetical protein